MRSDSPHDGERARDCVNNIHRSCCAGSLLLDKGYIVNYCEDNCIQCIKVASEKIVVESEMPAIVHEMAFRLPDIMNSIHNEFGLLDSCISFTGIFLSDGQPRTRLRDPLEGKQIVIVCLNRERIKDRITAFSDLTHECVHATIPSNIYEGTLLEEGLATNFSESYLQKKLGVPIGNYCKVPSSYVDAAISVRWLFRCIPNPIRKIREKNPGVPVCRFTKEMIIEEIERYRSIDSDDEKLIKKLSRKSPR